MWHSELWARWLMKETRQFWFRFWTSLKQLTLTNDRSTLLSLTCSLNRSWLSLKMKLSMTAWSSIKFPLILNACMLTESKLIHKRWCLRNCKAKSLIHLPRKTVLERLLHKTNPCNKIIMCITNQDKVCNKMQVVSNLRSLISAPNYHPLQW